MSKQANKIVVVEDDVSMSRAMGRLLRTAGLQPIIFKSAEALLRTNAVTGAGCLIFDIRLPGLSGLQLYRQLKGAGSAPPVIFITANDSPSARSQAQGIGAYIAKPFSGRTLLDAVKRALASKSA
jgi:FixJ family two-component response regulator